MKIKKLLSVSLCASMLLSLVGCSCSPKDVVSNILNGGGQNGDTNLVADAKEVNKDAVFKEVASFTPDGFDYIDYIISANNKYYIGTPSYEYPDFEGGDDTETFTEDNPETEENGSGTEDDGEDNEFGLDDDFYFGDGEDYYSNMKVSFRVASFSSPDDASYKVLELSSNENIYGGNIWGVDSEENYYLCVSTWEQETDKEKYFLKKFSADGTLVKTEEIKSDEEYFYVRYLLVDPDGNTYVASDASIYIFDKELNLKSKYTPEAQDCDISGMVLNNKNEFVFQLSTWTESEYSTKTYILDANGKAKEDEKLSNMLATKEVVSGKGYDYYYRTSSSIMGFDSNDKKATEVMNFYDSDIDPTSGYGTACFSDKEHFVMAKGEDIGVSFFEKIPANQVVEKEIITLGTVWGSYGISSQIIEFNKNSDIYRIKLVDYSEYATPDDWEAGSKRFNSDLTSGNAPDIIVPDASQVSNLIDKGVFTDLTPLMAMSDGIKKEDLVENARTVFARDDKLYCVFPSFMVQAAQVKKTYYKEGMTIDDVIEWEKQTGNKAFSSDFTKSGILNMFMSLGMDAFLDPNTGKCSFDSDEFIKILEYANTYPLSIGDDYWQNYDYDAYLYEFRSNKSLINVSYIDDIKNYNWTSQYRFGEDVALMGMPIEGSQGAVLSIDSVIGISDKSTHKEAAWEFVKTCFTPEYYENLGWGMPSVESEFDARAKLATEKDFYIDEDGKKVEIDQTYWLMDEEKTVYPLTMDQVAEIKDFVTHVNNVYSWDEELNKIVDEETQGYFEGQKSASEVAKIIQSRLQIYINEKK